MSSSIERKVDSWLTGTFGIKEITVNLPPTSEYRKSSDVTPDTYVIGGDSPLVKLHLVAIRRFERQKLGPADRLTVVSFDPKTLGTAIAQQRETLGIPSEFTLDPRNPVVFSNRVPRKQQGGFYRFMEEYDVPPTMRQLLKNIEAFREFHKEFPNSEAHQLAKLIEERTQTGDARNLPHIFEEWASGKDVYIHNAGSFLRGSLPGHIALAFVPSPRSL